MAMLPVFIIGVIIGVLITIVYNTYKEETPTEARFRMQQAELTRERSDKEMLHNLVDKLYLKIDELEKELNEKREV